jgi:hypothetical protein
MEGWHVVNRATLTFFYYVIFSGAYASFSLDDEPVARNKRSRWSLRRRKSALVATKSEPAVGAGSAPPTPTSPLGAAPQTPTSPLGATPTSPFGAAPLTAAASPSRVHSQGPDLADVIRKEQWIQETRLEWERRQKARERRGRTESSMF